MPRPQSSEFKKPTIRPFNEVLLVFVLFLVLSKIDEIRNLYFRCMIARARICIYNIILTSYSKPWYYKIGLQNVLIFNIINTFFKIMEVIVEFSTTQ